MAKVLTVGRFKVEDMPDCVRVSLADDLDNEPEYFDTFKGTGDDIELMSEISAGNGIFYLEELWAIHTEGSR